MPRPLKWLLVAALVAAVVVVLFTVVFPEVERRLEDPTFGAAEVVAAAQVVRSAS